MEFMTILNDIRTDIRNILEGPAVPKQNMVSLSLEDYLEMKRVYDLNKDKKYQIELNVNTHYFMEENGTRTQIGSVHSGTFNFPDDTSTKLTEIWTEMHENSIYLKYLEDKLKKTQADKYEADQRIRNCSDRIHQLEKEKEELLTSTKNESVWYRIRCALANRKL